MQAKPGRQTNISTKRDSTSVESSEELISDKSSAASDVFESSFSGSSSVQDKKVLPAPNKVMMSILNVTTILVIFL